MRFWFVLVLLSVSVSLAATASTGLADDGVSRLDPDSSAGEMIPPFAREPAGRELSSAGELAGWRASIEAERPLRMWVEDETASSGSKGSYLPVLYSLLIPGTGEIALGYPKRGVVLIALEVVAWVGYANYRDSGLEGRTAFEAFADAHWDHDRWIMNHPAVEGLQNPTFEDVDSIGQYHWSGWPGYHSYAAKDDVKLNYYENIGKYNWFISGWEDWDPVNKPRDTLLRDQYRALRRESNSDLDTANRFVYLSIATRVFSLVETVILARRQGSSGDGEKKNYSFKTRSTGLASGEVAFVYRF